MWNGPRAALVGFYEPPADPAAAGPDLAARCDAARRWGRPTPAAGCAGVRHPADRAWTTCRHALGRNHPGRPGAARRRLGRHGHANAGAVLPIPPGLPPVGELRARARAVHDGAPTPTLAAVDLAERQAVAGGYVAPVRRAMVAQPYLTYSLIAIFVVIWVLEYTTLSLHPTATGPDICSWGALPNALVLPGLRPEPGVRRRRGGASSAVPSCTTPATCTTCSSTASPCCSSAGWWSSCTDGSCCSERS